MGFSSTGMKTFSNNFSVSDHYGSNKRIRACFASSTLSKFKCSPHILNVPIDFQGNIGRKIMDAVSIGVVCLKNAFGYNSLIYNVNSMVGNPTLSRVMSSF
jgi:hypothetical protein